MGGTAANAGWNALNEDPNHLPKAYCLVYFPCYSLLLSLDTFLVKRVIQYWLDKSTIHVVPRWCFFLFLLFVFFLRIYLVQGYFIVAYGLGIFLLNNFIGEQWSAS